MPGKKPNKKVKMRKSPYWNRDEKEYEDLNIIQDSVRAYSQMLRGWSNGRGGSLNIKGWISALRQYSASLWNYFKWIKGYLEDTGRQDEMDRILSLLETSEIWIKNANRLTKYNQFPKYYMKAFYILEEVEQELNDNKIKLGMGVRLETKYDSETLEDRYMKRSMKG